jgi:hypothetical protein
VALPLPPDDPADLEDFPPLRPPPGRLARFWRLHRHFDPDSGAPRGPFWFASAEPDDPGGGRYDLPAPLGANYWAGTAAGAWLEVFRDTLVVDVADLRRRRLARTRAPAKLHLANLLVKAAHRFGLTAEVHTTPDLATTRRWAAAWQRAGFQGIWGQARHDPTVKLRTLTLLDLAGEHQPFGWSWEVQLTEPADDADLLQEMAAWGYAAASVPFDVATTDPPSG